MSLFLQNGYLNTLSRLKVSASPAARSENKHLFTKPNLFLASLHKSSLKIIGQHFLHTQTISDLKEGFETAVQVDTMASKICHLCRLSQQKCLQCLKRASIYRARAKVAIYSRIFLSAILSDSQKKNSKLIGPWSVLYRDKLYYTFGFDISCRT